MWILNGNIREIIDFSSSPPHPHKKTLLSRELFVANVKASSNFEKSLCRRSWRWWWFQKIIAIRSICIYVAINTYNHYVSS